MILRLLFALISLAILSALLYFQQDSDVTEVPSNETVNAAPGFIAIHAHMIETGVDGHALYRLDADRIEQPTPQGMIFLTAPKLDYQPEQGNPWTMTALHGQLPQAARSADLAGAVHAEGIPAGSNMPMRIDTEVLHVDMAQQLATTNAEVHVTWEGYRLRGRGMRADLKINRVQLEGDVHGALATR
jgi:LPS export ABC transporter protein LptC